MLPVDSVHRPSDVASYHGRCFFVIAIAGLIAACFSAVATARTYCVFSGDDSVGYVSAATRAETPLMFSSLSLEETIRRFFDARLDPTEPRRFSHRMVRADSPKSNETRIAKKYET